MFHEDFPVFGSHSICPTIPEPAQTLAILSIALKPDATGAPSRPSAP
jgi:hypothetical protein